MTHRDKESSSKAQKDTVTCPHCRYEYPAKEARCAICGYPWPWLKSGKRKETRPKA